MIIINKARIKLINNILFYILIFISVNTAQQWIDDQSLSRGEIFRFDNIIVLGKANIYHIYSAIIFIVIFILKFNPQKNIYKKSESNYLRNVFWIYFIIVNILIYFTVILKNIVIKELGIAPITTFFIFLSITIYIQNVILINKNRNEINRIIFIIELMILFRCLYSIIKYFLGYGSLNPLLGGIRIGTEDDFADFFILLFIIAFSSMLFNKKGGIKEKIIHLIGIICSSYVAIFSYRRFFIIEYIVAIVIISFIYIRNYNVNKNGKITIIIIIIISIALPVYIFRNKIIDNYYIGRLITSLAFISSDYESKYGVDGGHSEEILDGWYNVKKDIFLGITPFGEERMVRFKTKKWQPGVFVHNEYLQIWLLYGLLGLILLLIIYYKSIKIGFRVFKKYGLNCGLILGTFMICQVIKNIVWPTAIKYINITIIYIIIISIVIKCQKETKMSKI